jgi:hypothetical protein
MKFEVECKTCHDTFVTRKDAYTSEPIQKLLEQGEKILINKYSCPSCRLDMLETMQELCELKKKGYLDEFSSNVLSIFFGIINGDKFRQGSEIMSCLKQDIRAYSVEYLEKQMCVDSFCTQV